MGIGFVLFVWVILGIVVSGVLSILVGLSVTRATRHLAIGRRKAIFVFSMYPFLCLFWAGCITVSEMYVDIDVLHKNPGFGDYFYVLLPNGYKIAVIDELRNGWVFNPKLKSEMEGGLREEEGVQDVNNLQVEGRYILGDSSGVIFEPRGADYHVAPYFLLDTANGEQVRFTTPEALRDAAKKLNIVMNLYPFEQVYRAYRSNWYDVLFRILFWGPPAIGWIFLVRRIKLLSHASKGHVPTTA